MRLAVGCGILFRRWNETMHGREPGWRDHARHGERWTGHTFEFDSLRTNDLGPETQTRQESRGAVAQNQKD